MINLREMDYSSGILSLRDAKNAVEAVLDERGLQNFPCKIDLIKLLRSVTQVAFEEGERKGRERGDYDPETGKDAFDRGYERGSEDARESAKAVFEDNFEHRAHDYMCKRINEYREMRDLMGDNDRDAY